MQKGSGVYPKEGYDLMESIREFMGGIGRNVGAVFIFVGVVRGESEYEKEVQSIEIEAYEEVAATSIRRICEEIERQFRVSVAMHHLFGHFRVGEPMVFVAVGGRHRAEAIKALETAVARYKSEAPIFKKEVYADGSSRWIPSVTG